jgi:hypothetical protein
MDITERLDAIAAVCDAALALHGGATTKEVTMPYANVPGPTTPEHVTAPGVRVQWARDSHVQLTVLPMTGGMPDEEARDKALWSSLNREGCNELIRQLRQARDDAFGKDA